MTTKKLSAARQILKDLRGKDLSFGKALEAIRLSDEMSQVDFARKLKIAKAYLCDLEKGRRHASPTKAAIFATILGYPIEQFVALTIEDELREAGLKLKIELRAA